MIDELLKEKILKDLFARKSTPLEAAKKLGVTTRTIRNYWHRFLHYGPEGLKDRRKGNHRKLTPTEELAIVRCKKERPQRSARLIRDMLGLKVSDETVRLILVKHGLSRKSLLGRPQAPDFAPEPLGGSEGSGAG